MLLRLPHRQFLLLLGALLAIEFVIFAIEPHDRKDWLLENALVVLFIGFMAGTYRRFTLSRISYFLIFVFLSLHLIGAHYTYSLVPYDDWFRAVTGCSPTRCARSSSGWQDCAVSGVTFFRSTSPCLPRCFTN